MLKLNILALYIGLVFSVGHTMAMDVGVEQTDYSPYFYIDTNSEYQGAARALIDLFSKTQKIDVTYHPMPVPRLFNEFKKGSIDLKFPDNPLWSASFQEEIKVYYSKPVLAARESVLIRPSHSHRQVKSIGKILGFSTPGLDDRVKSKGIQIVETKTIEQLIHMLMSDRVHAIYFNESVAKEVTDSLYANSSLSAHPDFTPFDYAYHLSSIEHPELIEEFDQFMVSNETAVTKILQDYGLQ